MNTRRCRFFVAVFALAVATAGLAATPASAFGTNFSQTDASVDNAFPRAVEGGEVQVNATVNFNWFFLGGLRWNPVGELSDIVDVPPINQTVFESTEPSSSNPAKQPLVSTFTVRTAGLSPVKPGEWCSAAGSVNLEQEYWRYEWNPHTWTFDNVQDWVIRDSIDLCVQALPSMGNLDVRNIGTTAAELSWKATQAFGATSYSIKGVGVGELASVALGSTSTRLAGLTPDTDYVVTVEAVDQNGSVVDTTESVTFQTAPSMGAASITSIGETSATVNWSATAASSAIGYEVSLAGGRSQSVPLSATSVDLTGLEESTEYVVSVRAVDAEGRTVDESSTVTFVTRTPLPTTTTTIPVATTTTTTTSGSTTVTVTVTAPATTTPATTTPATTTTVSTTTTVPASKAVPDCPTLEGVPPSGSALATDASNPLVKLIVGWHEELDVTPSPALLRCWISYIDRRSLPEAAFEFYLDSAFIDRFDTEEERVRALVDSFVPVDHYLIEDQEVDRAERDALVAELVDSQEPWREVVRALRNRYRRVFSGMNLCSSRPPEVSEWTANKVYAQLVIDSAFDLRGQGGVLAWLYFYDVVKAGGDLDLKRDDFLIAWENCGVFFAGRRVSIDVPGNIAFGLYGRLGYEPFWLPVLDGNATLRDFLLAGAGAAQLVSNGELSREEAFGRLLVADTRGRIFLQLADNPCDQYAIAVGIDAVEASPEAGELPFDELVEATQLSAVDNTRCVGIPL
jgi:hypothetical protein